MRDGQAHTRTYVHEAEKMQMLPSAQQQRLAIKVAHTHVIFYHNAQLGFLLWHRPMQAAGRRRCIVKPMPPRLFMVPLNDNELFVFESLGVRTSGNQKNGRRVQKTAINLLCVFLARSPFVHFHEAEHELRKCKQAFFPCTSKLIIVCTRGFLCTPCLFVRFSIKSSITAYRSLMKKSMKSDLVTVAESDCRANLLQWRRRRRRQLQSTRSLYL